MESTISSALSSAEAYVTQIKGPDDREHIILAESALSALKHRFTSGEGFEHIERFSRIQDLYQVKIAPKSGYGSYGSSLSSVGRVGSRRPVLPGTRILGSTNQYQDGTHPAGTFSRTYRVACSSTTVAFMARFLNHGTAGLNGGKVDQIIRKGQDEFLPAVLQRRVTLGQVIGPEMVPEDPAKGRKLQGFLEGKLIPAAKGDRKNEALGKLTVYGVPFEFDIVVKDSVIHLTLRNGKEVLNKWTGEDLTEISQTLAQDMLREARRIAIDSSPELRGNSMAPVDVRTAYDPWIGETPRSPDAFFLASKAIPKNTLQETRRLQIREMLTKELLPYADAHGKVSASITINGQTLGIGLQKERDQVTVALFDSHGKTRLHGRSEGYAYTTNSIDEAATILINMMKIEDGVIDMRGVGQEYRAWLEQDQAQTNEVSLWLALPREVPVPFLEDAPHIQAPVVAEASSQRVEEHKGVRGVRSSALEQDEKKSSPPRYVRREREADDRILQEFYMMSSASGLQRPEEDRSNPTGKDESCVIS